MTGNYLKGRKFASIIALSQILYYFSILRHEKCEIKKCKYLLPDTSKLKVLSFSVSRGIYQAIAVNNNDFRIFASSLWFQMRFISHCNLHLKSRTRAVKKRSERRKSRNKNWFFALHTHLNCVFVDIVQFTAFYLPRSAKKNGNRSFLIKSLAHSHMYVRCAWNDKLKIKLLLYNGTLISIPSLLASRMRARERGEKFYHQSYHARFSTPHFRNYCAQRRAEASERVQSRKRVLGN